MSTFRTPVGPQPSRVYWRRRLIVALGLVAVVVVIILIVVRPGSGTPAPTPSVSNTETNAPPTGGSTNPSDAEACDPAKVTVDPGTDANSYDAGVNPVLTFSLKSSMTVPCSFSAGSDVQTFVITSGDEQIWSSKDCQTDGVAATILLQPGVPFGGSTLTWDRTRSSTDTCNTTRDQVIAGGASYHLAVTVGDVTSKTTKQFLLN